MEILFFLIFIFGIIALFIFVKIWGYLYPFLFWGGINVATTKEKIEKMVQLLEIKPGQTIVDLGAGEGKLMIALANAGAVVYGYEINPFLVAKAKKNIKKAGLEGKIFIFCKNLWNQNLKKFDAVAIYPMGHMMKKLEKKFEKELKPGTKVVSNYFTFPNWRPIIVESNVYLYIKK